MIKNGAKVNSKDNIYGWSPLHKAAEAGNEKIAEILLENGADVDARNHLGNTPLYIAAINGKLVV